MQLLHWGLVTEVSTPLLALGAVYLVEGLSDLAWLAQKYYYKDELGASPAQVSLFLALATIPWCFKPLLGFVSDSLPLFGYRRRSYLILASGAAAGSWLYLSSGGGELGPTLCAVLAGSAAGALSDVVIDSIMVEQARGEEAHGGTGNLQAMCWAAFALGQIGTAACSGTLLEEHGPRFVFALTAAFPLLTVAAAMLVHEERVGRGKAAGEDGGQGAAAAALALMEAESPTAAPAAAPPGSPASASGGLATADVSGWARHLTTGAALDSSAAAAATAAAGSPAAPLALQLVPPLPQGPGVELDAARVGAAAVASASFASTPPSSPTPALAAAAASPATACSVPQPARHGREEGLAQRVAAATGSARGRLAAQGSAVWGALSAPALAWPVAFLFALSATPSADDAVFYYQVEALGFSPSFLGGVQLAIAVASLGGVWLYNAAFKSVPLRSFLLYGSLLGAALQSSDLLLVARVNTWVGLDDHLFVTGGSIVTSVVANVLSMPTLVLAARLCPKGLEATMFATIMSLWNLADALRYAGGAGLMQALGVGSGEYENLPLLVGICSGALLLLPLPLLAMVPATLTCDGANLDSSMEGLAAGGARPGGDDRALPYGAAAVAEGSPGLEQVPLPHLHPHHHYEDARQHPQQRPQQHLQQHPQQHPRQHLQQQPQQHLQQHPQQHPQQLQQWLAYITGVDGALLLPGEAPADGRWVAPSPNPTGQQQRRGRGLVAGQAGGSGRGEERDSSDGLRGAVSWFGGGAVSPAVAMAVASRSEVPMAPRPLGAASAALAGVPSCRPGAPSGLAPPTEVLPSAPNPATGAALPLAAHLGAAATPARAEGQAAGSAPVAGGLKLGSPAAPGQGGGRARLWRREHSSGGSSPGMLASGDWAAAGAPGAPGGNVAAKAVHADGGGDEAGAAGAVGGAPMLPEGRHSAGPTAAPIGRAVPFPFAAELRRRAVRGPRRVLPGSDSDEDA